MKHKLLLLRTALVAVIVGLWMLPVTAAFAANSVNIPFHTDSLSTTTCEDSEFGFVMTQIDSITPPNTISVTFTQGATSKTVAVGGLNITGSTAHYTETLTQLAALGFNTAQPITVTAVEDAVGTSNTVSTYPGNFNLSHIPCLPPPPIPEVPLAAIYPVLGAVTFAAGYGLRRLRRRSSTAGQVDAS